jgi:hypothetical protein
MSRKKAERQVYEPEKDEDEAELDIGEDDEDKVDDDTIITVSARGRTTKPMPARKLFKKMEEVARTEFEKAHPNGPTLEEAQKMAESETEAEIRSETQQIDLFEGKVVHPTIETDTRVTETRIIKSTEGVLSFSEGAWESAIHPVIKRGKRKGEPDEKRAISPYVFVQRKLRFKGTQKSGAESERIWSEFTHKAKELMHEPMGEVVLTKG